ncbi:copper amine oxidase [Microsporum canis CBS 113480]|uniref:Amine oxidase n=1 Tax=Arthroderma otae (strain ATCC MYA-4605 / CBS 113480) TaxID=554155 RepID=C5FXH8_ARTOC|nr:copper amine oxidase [Microsporum canis CBS 113480]EEQ35018.1 copper amine oxidase [Microsporum canis CBS 113480]
MAPHPFDPVAPAELRLAVKVLENAFPGVPLRYKVIEVQEPIKKDVVPYIEAERLCVSLPRKPARVLMALFHRMDTKSFMKALINIDTKVLLHAKESPRIYRLGTHELIEMEEICLKHPAVKAEIEKLNLPPGVTVCSDPWIYGTDDQGETRRLFQFYLYIVDTDDLQHNHYSLPCTISPVFDGMTRELVRIDHLPTGTDHSTSPTKPWKPVKAVQYAHSLLDEPTRTDLKPYIVQQPEGPSFSVDGNFVCWQKWRFHVGFNFREGMVLYGVTYDRRNVFYRLAVNEMTVPYGDPRAPYHRKQAFDVGDVGFGVNANQLSLGCDCLGHIKYFDGYRIDSKGNPVLLKNVLCLHEQDNGIQHKHTNYRSQAATVVRNRQLVLQMICTVANYEYIFAWIFDQAGNIELEVRATGILSTMPIEEGISVPFGTNVAPGVMAAYHQHIFSMRIDPAIDGYNNTVIYQDSIPMPDDPSTNPYGVGYVQETKVIKRSTAADLSVPDARVFKIRNDNIINPTSGKPVAFNRKRAQFATRPIWVTKYHEDELYAAGEFTNQSKTSSGVEEWVARDENVENTDVVLWHTFALTHNPRPEDFPVMPMEKISVMLRPDGFFEKNPALDVPQSTQNFNQSSLHVDTETAEAKDCACPSKL